MVLLRTQSFVAKTPSGAITKSYSVPDIGRYISARQKYQHKWECHYATYYRPSTYSKTPLRGDHFYHDAKHYRPTSFYGHRFFWNFPWPQWRLPYHYPSYRVPNHYPIYRYLDYL